MFGAKGDEKYNPEPDVTVIDSAIAIGQIYVERIAAVRMIRGSSREKK
jgi:hypothetical protein